jgi:hypothetical protein
MLAVLAARKSHDFKKSCEVYEADQALSNPARMTQIDRYLTLIIKPEMRAELFETFQSFDVLRERTLVKKISKLSVLRTS